MKVEQVFKLSANYGMVKSTVCTVLKIMCELKNIQVAKGITTLSKLCRLFFLKRWKIYFLCGLKKQKLLVIA